MRECLDMETGVDFTFFMKVRRNEPGKKQKKCSRKIWGGKKALRVGVFFFV